MLIVAIPKSASTALMVTIARLQHIPCRQIYADTMVEINIARLPQPEAFSTLFAHTDIREYTPREIKYFCHPEKIYKQHIPPTKNNVKLLQHIPKVVLLRDPLNIAKSYRRSRQVLGEKIPGYKRCDTSLSEYEWIRAVQRMGLMRDLGRFYHGWLADKENPNTLIIYYEDVVLHTTRIVNRVESFFGFPVTRIEDITLAKERYTRLVLAQVK